MAQDAIACPGAEGHLGDQLGTDPMDTCRGRLAIAKRRLFLLQGLKLFQQIAQPMRIEAGPHFPCIDQLAFLVVIA